MSLGRNPQEREFLKLLRKAVHESVDALFDEMTARDWHDVSFTEMWGERETGERDLIALVALSFNPPEVTRFRNLLKSVYETDDASATMQFVEPDERPNLHVLRQPEVPGEDRGA